MGKSIYPREPQDIPGASGTNPKRKGIPNHKGLVEGLGYVPFGVCCLRRTWVGLLVWEANIPKTPGHEEIQDLNSTPERVIPTTMQNKMEYCCTRPLWLVSPGHCGWDEVGITGTMVNRS